MLLREVAELTANRANVPKNTSYKVIKNFCYVLHEMLISGEEVSLPTVGKFKFSIAKERNNNLNPGAIIPRQARVHFQITKALRNEISRTPLENLAYLFTEDD